MTPTTSTTTTLTNRDVTTAHTFLNQEGQAEAKTPTQKPPARVHDLNYSIAGRDLLKQIRFDLMAGELLMILGRNGAGKSTLLKHLSGDLRSAGVELFGWPLDKVDARQTAQRRAVLPQQNPMTFAYEVLDVVLLGRIPHNTRETEEDRLIATDCLKRVGLEGYEQQNIQTLSGGEQQRVHLARSLAQIHQSAQSQSKQTTQAQPEQAQPDRVLLLDEPTASLDLAHQHATLRLARELCRENVGVLAIVHDLNLAAQYADRILILADGEVLSCDTPENALTCEHIRTAYGHEVVVTRHPCLACPLVVSAN